MLEDRVVGEKSYVVVQVMYLIAAINGVVLQSPLMSIPHTHSLTLTLYLSHTHTHTLTCARTHTHNCQKPTPTPTLPPRPAWGLSNDKWFRILRFEEK